jgi:preprotein translocase subunit SecA
MVSGIFVKVFGTKNGRELKRMSKIVARVNACEPQMQALSDDELKAKTTEFRQRLAAGETVDSLLPEAFAAVREAAQRVLGQRPYDVQIMGGITLTTAAFLRCGPEKAKRCATLPAYLNALTGDGVHRHYGERLPARRTRMDGPILQSLGMTVGVINRRTSSKREAYLADVTAAPTTNSIRLSARQHGVHAEGQIFTRPESRSSTKSTRSR